MARISSIALLGWLLLAAFSLPVQAKNPLCLTGPAIYETLPLLRISDASRHTPLAGAASFIPWGAPDQLRAMIATQKVDVAIMTVASAATLHNKGIPCVLVALYSSPAWLVTTDETLTSVDGLAGKEVLLPFGPGEMPELYLRILLAGRDISFTPRHVGNALQAANMLRTGQGKYALLPEPVASRLMTGAVAASTDTPLPRKCFDLRSVWADTFPEFPGIALSGLAVVGPAATSPLVRQQVREAYREAADWVQMYPADARVLANDSFPALARQLEGKDFVETYPICLLDPTIGADSLQFLLKKIHEISPASLGGQLPGSGFLELTNAAH